MAAPANMQAAWDQYWQTFAPGSTVNWSSGTLTRNQDGTATYRDPNGSAQTFSSSTPIETVAGISPYIAQQWQTEFGYTPGSNPSSLGYAGSTGSGVTVGPGPAPGTSAPAPAPSTGGIGLINSTGTGTVTAPTNAQPASINTPPATLVNQPNNLTSSFAPTARSITAPQANTTMYSAMGAAAAPNVTAGNASAGLINATSATNPPNVTAGTGTAQQATGTTATGAPGVTAGTATGGTATAQGYASTNANASLQAPAATYTANTFTPDSNSTVKGQIRDIIAENSPLMQQAETRALQKMNTRGLLNSSLAVGAGQSAVFDAALPIAQQDAQTFTQAGLSNQQARNTSDQFNAGSTNQVNSQNSQLETNVNLANAGASNTAAQFGAQADNTASQFNAQLYTTVSQFNVDNALKAGVINQEQANKMAQFNAQSANDAAKFNAASANDMAKLNLDAALKAGIINQEQANIMARFNAEQTNKLAMFDVQNDADIAKFNASESNALKKLGMDSNTKLALADIEAGYKTLMQTSASASDLYKQMVANAASIMSNKDMDTAAKNTAIQNQIALLNSGLGVIGKIANVDLSGLLTFTPTPETAAPAAAPATAPAEQTMNTYREPAPAPTGLINTPRYYEPGAGV